MQCVYKVFKVPNGTDDKIFSPAQIVQEYIIISECTPLIKYWRTTILRSLDVREEIQILTKQNADSKQKEKGKERQRRFQSDYDKLITAKESLGFGKGGFPTSIFCHPRFEVDRIRLLLTFANLLSNGASVCELS
ncbi:hypothetical protein TNCT_386901 [Trichonephila clavata]|uniref:Uncharacterized protein n=1 Tax=Trichonephila clavata TaxID=2740835 RepID=A0A8X6KVF8_TRICU|nr:hypothetical protein TNCT_386901 [Trichonephila clavata]